MTTEIRPVVSKVLVLDSDVRQHEAIKAFCLAQDLVAVKLPDDNPLAVLRSNADLGAVLLWENQGSVLGAGIALGREIHRIRPELPIFLRRERRDDLDDLGEGERRCFRAAYRADRMNLLREAIGASLFSRVYPTALVRGITELTRAAIEGLFSHVDVEHEAPCLVKDRIIFGELFSLIPLESSWCRGYMMLQTEERKVVNYLRCDSSGPYSDPTDFREINNLLGEATNMAWGAFKNRFISQAPDASRLTQVPIIVNHLHRYISFGSEDPLLCVKYLLTDRRAPTRGSITLYQWFAFSLAWAPDKFAENVQSAEDACETGALELF